MDNQLRQSADRLGIQRTGDDVRRVSLSERMTVMYPAGGYHRPEPKLFLMTDENITY